MKLLKKLWTELTRARSIEFVSYETEEEENRRLNKELKNRISQIQAANRNYILQKLTAWVKAGALYRDNILLTEGSALQTALALYNEAKTNGRLDELNRVKEG